jgi:hypothetical protein
MDVIHPVRLYAAPPDQPAAPSAKALILPLAIFAAIGLVLYKTASSDFAEEDRRRKNPVRGIQTREDYERFLAS